MNKRIIKKHKKNFESYKTAAILQSVMMWTSDEFYDEMEPVRLVKAIYGAKHVDISAVQNIIDAHNNSEYEATSEEFAIPNSNLYCDINRNGGCLKNSIIKRWAEHYHERFYLFYKRWKPCIDANYGIYEVEFINGADQYYPVGMASTIDEAIETAEKLGDEIAKEWEDKNGEAMSISNYPNINIGAFSVEVETWNGKNYHRVAELVVLPRDAMFG